MRPTFTTNAWVMHYVMHTLITLGAVAWGFMGKGQISSFLLSI